MVRRAPQTRSLRRQTGFALVEAIVAAVVLGFALAIILGLASQAVSAQSRGEAMETAARLADERLNLVLATGPEGYGSVFDSSGACDAPFADYSYFVEIEPNGPGEAYNVRATISWRVGARTQALMLETRIAPRLGDDPDPDRKPSETVNRNAM